MESKEKTNYASIKLRKGRRSVLKLPRGCQVVIEGKPTDGKPAVTVEFPDGTKITHETLTQPPATA